MTSLIINKRSELPRVKRLIWDGVTLFLWGVFISLWFPVLEKFYQIITSGVPSDEIAQWIYENISSVTFEYAVLMLVGTPMILFVLSRLSRHQAPSEHLIFHQDDYAHYFSLSSEALKVAQEAQCITVHFDDHGGIVSLETMIDKK